MSLEFSQIIKSLKTAIKSKGFTYKSLAERLQMSEAGVKRLLNASDCSLQRVLRICEIINVDLQDLIEASADIDSEIQVFSKEQLALFDRSPLHLRYYYKLRVEFLDPEEIRDIWKLTDQQNQKLLLDLDKVQLIELQPDNKIGNLGRRNVEWRNLGPSFLRLKYDFTNDLMDYFKAPGNEGKGHYPMYHLRLSAKSRDELYSDLDETIEKYVKRGDRERISLKPENVHPLNIAFLLAPISGFSQAEVPTQI